MYASDPHLDTRISEGDDVIKQTCLSVYLWLGLLCGLALAACQFGPSGPAAGDDDDDDPDAALEIDARQTSSPDAAPGSPDARPDAPPATVGPGGACSCDADCASDGGQPGVCVYGVCMVRATGACPSGGAQQGCPAGSRCWSLSGSDVGPLCWPDCSAHTCAGTCDSDGSCVPTAASDCDPTCGSACSCTPTSCPSGQVCVGGSCVEQMSGGPGPGPGPSCTGLPARDCTGTTCGDLVTFSPRTNTAWDDYPINGETTTNQYRSYLRRDLMMLVGYATSKVACKAAAWTAGNGGALGLGDMSEANGAIPGTSIGSPGHPANTHTSGYDIDLAYYQSGTANNRLRPICAHTSGGSDQYHCVSAPTTLDVWRTALFLGAVFESTRTRVIGVDGQAGPLLLSALNTLCANGWIEAGACNNIVLAYETTNTGQGWYYHHHHHAHISLKRVSSLVDDDAQVGDAAAAHDGAAVHDHGPGCPGGDCAGDPRLKALPGREPGLHRLR